MGISLDETTTREVVEAVWGAFGVTASVEPLDGTAPEGIPAALARDAAVLRGAGHRLVRATPIDQFLWSPRLESVCVFRRERA